MSKLINTKEWKDREGRILEVGQRIATVKGKNLHIGEVLWFTPAGVTIASERGEEIETISVLFNDKSYAYSKQQKNGNFYILD